MKNLLFLLILTHSCAPTMYIPNQQNIPAFEKKGQLVINASKVNFGFDIQSAYSVSNQLGILINSCLFENEFDENQLSNTPSEGWGLEIGSGYYKNYKNIILENYLVGGVGKFINTQGQFGDLLVEPHGYLKSDFFRIANQTSITYSKKYLNISLSNRISYLHYYDISNEPYIFSDIDMNAYLKSSPNFTYIEPALTIRSGFKNVKLQMQLQRSFSLKSIPSTDHYQFIDGTAHIGIFVKI